MKIPLATYQLFASADETRWILTQPRITDDGLIVATDGRVLVEAPVEEVEAEGLLVLGGNFPAYRVVIDPEFSEPLVPVEMPPLPPAKVERKVCQECKGKGFERLSRLVKVDCEECDGKGQWDDHSEWVVDCPGFKIGGFFMEKILHLPNLRWFAPVKDADSYRVRPVRFTFGVRGRGVLMPLRPFEVEAAAVAKPEGGEG